MNRFVYQWLEAAEAQTWTSGPGASSWQRGSLDKRSVLSILPAHTRILKVYYISPGRRRAAPDRGSLTRALGAAANSSSVSQIIPRCPGEPGQL